MPFYTASNTNLKINGTGYYVSNASINSSASISPVFRVGSIASEEYFPEGQVQGTLDMNYYLTGADPIKQLISDDSPVSGNFCGLYFNSGYLNSYSLTFPPNQPLQVSAGFTFYGQVSGTFSPAGESLSDKATLNASDFEFNETGIINDNQILDLNYQYNNSLQAFYSIQETGENPAPVSVRSTAKAVSLEVVTNDYDINIPSTGLSCQGRIVLKDGSNVERESYNISGVMLNQSMSVDPSTTLGKGLSIMQANLALPPSIEGLAPVSGPTGTSVTLSGSNFQDVETVLFQGQDLSYEAPVNGTGISITVPKNMPGGSVLSAPFEIKTKGGSSISTGVFTVS
jgi:hypothetical protein